MLVIDIDQTTEDISEAKNVTDLKVLLPTVVI